MKPGYLLEAKRQKTVVDFDGESHVIPEGSILFCSNVTRLCKTKNGAMVTEVTLLEAKTGTLFTTSPHWLKVVSRKK